MTTHISPGDAKDLGIALVDVREYPEYAAGSIAGSQLVPLSTIENKARAWDKKLPLLLVCRTGKRAADAAQKLESRGFQNLLILDGGLEAWSGAGLPLGVLDRKPWSLERQVRAIAGSMILISCSLGLAVSPWFFAWTLLVGFGLSFSGITDLCLMATVLGRMPWNRPAQAAVGAKRPACQAGDTA